MIPKEKTNGKWETIDKALTAVLKLVTLGLVVFALLSMRFCSEEDLKSTGEFTSKRFALLKVTKFSAGGFEFQFPDAASIGVEAGNLKGVAQELSQIAQTAGGTKIASAINKVAGDMSTYAERLSARDEKLIDAAKSASQAVPPSSESKVGWIFVGRRLSTGEWAPASDKIDVADFDQAKLLTVRKDAILLDVDPATQANSAAPSRPQPFWLVRAGNQKLKVDGTSKAKSIGDAELVWARVTVPATVLYESRP